jgi:hypothetical protein
MLADRAAVGDAEGYPQAILGFGTENGRDVGCVGDDVGRHHDDVRRAQVRVLRKHLRSWSRGPRSPHGAVAGESNGVVGRAAGPERGLQVQDVVCSRASNVSPAAPRTDPPAARRSRRSFRKIATQGAQKQPVPGQVQLGPATPVPE